MQLTKIQDHHSKYPNAVPISFDFEISAFLEEPTKDGDEEYMQFDVYLPLELKWIHDCWVKNVDIQSMDPNV